MPVPKILLFYPKKKYIKQKAFLGEALAACSGRARGWAAPGRGSPVAPRVPGQEGAAPGLLPGKSSPGLGPTWDFHHALSATRISSRWVTWRSARGWGDARGHHAPRSTRCDHCVVLGQELGCGMRAASGQ